MPPFLKVGQIHFDDRAHRWSGDNIPVSAQRPNVEPVSIFAGQVRNYRQGYFPAVENEDGQQSTSYRVIPTA